MGHCLTEIGRRPVIITGNGDFSMWALSPLCSAPNFEWFLVATFVQGMGTGCSGAMCRTVTRDCFDGDQLHRANSLVSMGVIFSPLIAPVLGGYLSSTFEWQASYWFLLIFGTLVTIAMMFTFDRNVAESESP